jgi:hypothetical protein
MTAKMSKERFPTDGDISGLILIPYDSVASGGPAAGETVTGQTSGAKGTVFQFYANPKRVAIGTVRNGPGSTLGTPFLPNENIEQDSNTAKTLLTSAIQKLTSNLISTGGQVGTDTA